MGPKKIMDETTNRYEYNRVRKECSGNCTWCRYHLGDNLDHKLYGEYASRGKMRFPNWKLVSKNKKQWMGNPVKYETNNNWGRGFTKIVF